MRVNAELVSNILYVSVVEGSHDDHHAEIPVSISATSRLLPRISGNQWIDRSSRRGALPETMCVRPAEISMRPTGTVRNPRAATHSEVQIQNAPDLSHLVVLQVHPCAGNKIRQLSPDSIRRKDLNTTWRLI